MNYLQVVLPFRDSFPSVYMCLSGASAPVRAATVEGSKFTAVNVVERV